MSIAAVAAMAAPAASVGIVADVAPAAANCGHTRSAEREIPVLFFGNEVGKTKVRMTWTDDCAGHITSPVYATPSETAGNGGVPCGWDPAFPSASWEGTKPPWNGFYGNGYYFNYNFKFSILGGPCQVVHGQHVEGYATGIGGSALFTWSDYAGQGTKEVH
jgi:hypothetical protein